MPKSLEEILAQTDDLARRFEEYEPRAADERDPAAYRALREAADDRSMAERRVVAAVRDAREAGFSWATIGPILGTSGEAARQRYSPHV